jgi:hypothetical protein
LMNLHQPVQKNPAHFAGHGAALKQRSRALSVQCSHPASAGVQYSPTGVKHRKNEKIALARFKRGTKRSELVH